MTVALEALRGRLFLRVAEVAQLTGADPRTVRRAIELGQIEGVKLSEGTVRIPAAPFWVQAGLDPVTLQPLESRDPPARGTPGEGGAPLRIAAGPDPAA